MLRMSTKEASVLGGCLFVFSFILSQKTILDSWSLVSNYFNRIIPTKIYPPCLPMGTHIYMAIGPAQVLPHCNSSTHIPSSRSNVSANYSHLCLSTSPKKPYFPMTINMRTPITSSKSSDPQIKWDSEVLPLEDFQYCEPQDPQPNISRAVQAQKFAWHPWHRIDYHLYLTFIEKRRDTRTRIEEVQLLESNSFRQVSLDDLFDNWTFAQVPGTSRIVTFMNLPVLPLSTQDPATARQIVLGIDLQTRHLLGYLFSSAPDHIADMRQIWEQGEVVIDIPISRFFNILQYTMEERREILDVGMFQYFRETTREFLLGLDIVITIQFAQFLDDFAELLWADGAHFRDTYKVYEEQLRDLLSKASRDAWFAARDEVTLDMFHQRKMRDLVSCNLFPNRREVVRGHASDAPVTDQVTPTEMSCHLEMISSQMQSTQKQMLQIFFVLVYLFASVA